MIEHSTKGYKFIVANPDRILRADDVAATQRAFIKGLDGQCSIYLRVSRYFATLWKALCGAS